MTRVPSPGRGRLADDELDLQVGVIHSRDPSRIVVPDFELDVGLLHDLELDVDGTYAVEGPSNGKLGFEEWAVKTIGKFETADADRSAWLTRAEYSTTAPKPRVARPACQCGPVFASTDD